MTSKSDSEKKPSSPYSEAVKVLSDQRAYLAVLGEDELVKDLDAAIESLSAPKPESAEAPAPWRAHGAAMDAKALSVATEIALMWGRDRSQFVSRIQLAVREAMDWTAAGGTAPPRPEASEQVCSECHGVGGHLWHEADGSERGETCGTCDGFGTAPQQPAPDATSVAVDEAMDRLRRGPDRLWMADLVGQQISVDRMREILTTALAGQSLKNESDQERQGGAQE